MKDAKKVQQDDDEDRYSGHPQNDIAKHGVVSFQVFGVMRRR
jgi:hypothetical protein